MATLTKRRKLIPRQRVTQPTPTPTPVATEPGRLYRGELPDDGAAVTAVCGCAGMVRYTSRQHGGYVRCLILDPCVNGRHERWTAGCTAGFPANQVAAVVDDRPQPGLFPALTPRVPRWTV
jgi:hypothetical protein